MPERCRSKRRKCGDLKGLVAALERGGHETGVDLLGLLHIADRYARSLRPGRVIDPRDVVSGYGRLHSRHLGAVEAICEEHGVDPRRILWEMRNDGPPIDMEPLATNLARRLRAEDDWDRRRATASDTEDYSTS